MDAGNEKIKVELTETMENTTPYASILTIKEFFDKSGLSQAIDDNIGARHGRGASDSKHILAMVASQTCGYDAIEHLNRLPAKISALGLRIPSVTAARNYAGVFVNDNSEAARCKGSCYVPEPNKYLDGFEKVHAHLFALAHRLSPKDTLTLDQDATYIESARGGSLYSYKGFRGYEAFNTYCPEYDLVVGTQYRDANVNPGYGQLDELKSVLTHVPDGVKKIRLRSDSAGYQIELLRYCAEGRNERFGVIDFAISCPFCPDFRKAVMNTREDAWRPLRDENGIARQEWAEIVYVPASLSTSKESPEYRFYAIRERMSVSNSGKTERDIQQRIFPDEEITYLEEQNPNIKKLHLTALSGKIYKVFGIVSNILDMSGVAIIRWHRLRCGKSEEAHDVLKSDFGGGHVPSHKFGVNAFWWNVSVLTMSVNNLIKRFFLPKDFANKRAKTLRSLFYTVVGKVVRHARETVLKLSSKDVGALLLVEALKRMEVLLVSRT